MGLWDFFPYVLSYYNSLNTSYPGIDVLDPDPFWGIAIPENPLIVILLGIVAFVLFTLVISLLAFLFKKVMAVVLKFVFVVLAFITALVTLRIVEKKLGFSVEIYFDELLKNFFPTT